MLLKPRTDKQKLREIKRELENYGTIDGDHHKMWLLDQIARILFDCPTEIVVNKDHTGKEHKHLDRGANEAYGKWAGKDWDEGIAP